MGAAYTPETWDAWTDRMKAEHGNGNGHGKSLNIEALRLLKTPTSQLAENGGSQHPDKRKEGGHGPTLADEVEHLLPTPGVAGGGKKVPEDAIWSGNAAYKPDGTKVQVHLDYIAEQRLLPTPTVMDYKASGGGYNGQTNVTLTDATVRHEQDWREYEAAIRRQEAVFGRPAPLPTELGAKGQPRLSPRFVEWLMNLPDGWVTDVPGISRNDMLKALGNGVVPAQCAAALRAFLHDTAQEGVA
jgi:DNA (cytosine-5)-methyltransferase 1